jgi:hypothetical protein
MENVFEVAMSTTANVQVRICLFLLKFILVFNWFFCEKDEYSGKNCEEESACAKNPCMNNGNCISQGLNEYFCVCLSKSDKLLFLKTGFFLNFKKKM